MRGLSRRRPTLPVDRHPSGEAREITSPAQALVSAPHPENTRESSDAGAANQVTHSLTWAQFPILEQLLHKRIFAHGHMQHAMSPVGPVPYRPCFGPRGAAWHSALGATHCRPQMVSPLHEDVCQPQEGRWRLAQRVHARSGTEVCTTTSAEHSGVFSSAAEMCTSIPICSESI